MMTHTKDGLCLKTFYITYTIVLSCVIFKSEEITVKIIQFGIGKNSVLFHCSNNSNIIVKKKYGGKNMKTA